MPKQSSGLLLYKIKNNVLKVFLVHPGGPFWKDKDKGTWSIPKGEIDDNDFSEENLFKNAIRELKEETGISVSEEKEKYLSLGSVTQKSGKIVHGWAYEGDWTGLLMCQSFVEIEWPPKSGKKMKIPEVDKADFFTLEKAKEKVNPAQIELIENLEKYLNSHNRIKP